MSPPGDEILTHMLTRMTLLPPGVTKSAKRSLLPDFIAPSVAGINFELLRARGINTCFIDLDGTVVTRGTYDIWDAIRPALERSGMDIYIATNRPASRDLKNLTADMGARGVIHPSGMYGKPMRRYFLSAMQTHSLSPQTVIMIGDRFVQDIYGANNAGIHTLLVRKMMPAKSRADRIFSVLEDRVTRLLLRRYR